MGEMRSNRQPPFGGLRLRPRMRAHAPRHARPAAPSRSAVTRHAMRCDAVDRQRAVGSVSRQSIRSGQLGGLDCDAGRQGGEGVQRPGGDEVGDASPPLETASHTRPGSGTSQRHCDRLAQSVGMCCVRRVLC